VNSWAATFVIVDAHIILLCFNFDIDPQVVDSFFDALVFVKFTCAI
jgi:hypothetical protein